VLAAIDYDPKFQTDRRVAGILDFGTVTATFTCSTQMAPYQHVTILGTEGRIEIEIPFNAPHDVSIRLMQFRGSQGGEVRFEPCDQYTIQADQFCLAIREGLPVPTPLSDAVANMKVLDAIRRSGTIDSWVSVA
jgi:predicted dehydrogenase